MQKLSAALLIKNSRPAAERSVNNMKSFIRILFLIVIICSAVISVRYAVELYRSKYTPRYLKGNAC